MSISQRTIAKDVGFSGVGLHTGEPVTLTLKPAAANEGISFRRVDIAGSSAVKLGTFDVVHGGEAGRYSAIKQGEVVFYTVEHLLSALAGLGITNVRVEMTAAEPPGLDGSAKEYLEGIKIAGVVDQGVVADVFKVREPITVAHNGASVSIVPCEDFKVSYALEYSHPMLRSAYTAVVTEDDYCSQIAPCRTFCLEEEADAVRAKGLGKGANHSNTLVFGAKGVVGNELRFSDEPARHKVLDVIGDLYLLGFAIRGHVTAYKSGHALNRELLKKIAEQKAKYEVKPATGGKPMDVREIMKIIPHRYPFLLVDRILEIETGKRAVALKNVTMNEAFFQGHFPVRPVMPGVLMIEAMAQVGGCIMLSDPSLQGKLAFFMSVDNAKFRKVVEPGDQLIMEVEIVKARSRIAQARGVCKVAGQVVCEADMGFAFGE